MDYANTAEAAFQDAGGRWSNWSSFIRKLLNTFLCASQISSNVRMKNAKLNKPVFFQNTFKNKYYLNADIWKVSTV